MEWTEIRPAISVVANYENGLEVAMLLLIPRTCIERMSRIFNKLTVRT